MSFEVSEEIKEPFYKFFACDYFATGEGRSIWLMVDRWYGVGWSDPLEDFKEFVNDSFYYPNIEELSERQFLDQYTRMMPYLVSHMIQKKDQPGFNWKTHLFFNYS